VRRSAWRPLRQSHGKVWVPAPATGFAFNTLALLNALERQPEVEASKTRDILIFNARDDRREALEIASGCAVGLYDARDIIRRSFDDSLEYARRQNIVG